MVGNILQFLLVVGVSFAALVALVSFFRFQNHVASAAALREDRAVGEEPFLYRLAGHLATGPRDPDPCLVVRVELAHQKSLVSDLAEDDQQALQSFMSKRLRSRIRGQDAQVCIEAGRHGLLVKTGREAAEGIVRRLAGAFADDAFQLASGGSVPLHVRVGAAACPEDGTELDALLAASAEALASTDGENEWVLASRPEPAEEPVSTDEDPLADVPASQQQLVDPVTGVLKEDHLGSTLQRFVARARNKGRPASVICLQIDQLERYRELYGADGADMLMAHLARILKSALREDDLLARYGAEQFVIMLGCAPDDALHAVERIAADVQARPRSLQGTEVLMKLAAGMAGSPDHGTVASEVFKLALHALEAAGTDGRGPYVLYEEGIKTHHAQHAAREAF